MHDDAALLRAYAGEGSAPAFTTLVARHADLVYSAALRRTGGDPHRAAEVSQMVFIALARKAAPLQRHPVLVAWLHQSTRWAAATLQRTERRRAHHEQAAAREASLAASAPALCAATSGATLAQATTDPTLDWDRLRPLLDAALDTLREADREAVLLRFFAQQPFAAIATQLGLSENAARMRVERALTRLARTLRRRGITSTAAALATALAAESASAAPAGLASTLASAALTTTATATATAAATTPTTTTATASWSISTLLMSKLTVGVLALLTLLCALALHRQSGVHAAAQAALSGVESAVREAETRLAIEPTPAQSDAPATPPATELTEAEIARLNHLIARGELDGRFTPLFQALRHAPAKLDPLKDLLVARDFAVSQAFAAAESEALALPTLTRAERRLIEHEAARPADAQIAALLGPADTRLYERYWETRPLRTRVAALIDRKRASIMHHEARLQTLVALFEPYAGAHLAAEEAHPGELVPLPDAFLAEALKLLTEEELAACADRLDPAVSAASRRMDEIARAAAYAGKLQLTPASARDYHTSPAPAPATLPR